MRVFILGVCGKFMAGVAMLAKQKGFDVIGCDGNAYPPMSTQLEEAGITILEGYDPAYLECEPDHVVIGNVMPRGNPLVEAVLNQQLSYQSGPQWLAENILHDRWVLAVSGTHGKTTTSSILTWILHATGNAPGFLIGGVANNFNVSAELGSAPFFVVEADEYDSAFFDKRSKFVHYHPRTLILNNLEFDHADIFTDLAAIQRQFHHLVRTVPGNGLIVTNATDQNLQAVLEQGCWTPTQTFSSTDREADWYAVPQKADSTVFDVIHAGKKTSTVTWTLCGDHNRENALAAIAAAHHVGVKVADAINALADFQGVKRRLEVCATVNDITIYDDFAHHPTAVATTLRGLRARVGNARIIAVLEFGSYTMCNGTHNNVFIPALQEADQTICIKSRNSDWDLHNLIAKSPQTLHYAESAPQVISQLMELAQPGDHILVMSNTGFAGFIPELISELKAEKSVSN